MIPLRLGNSRRQYACAASRSAGTGRCHAQDARRHLVRDILGFPAQQVARLALDTVITVPIGILVLYAAVCVLSLAAAGIMIDPSVLATQIGRHSGFGDYVRLALVAGALATVGGTLGGALESDAAVREAANAQREERP